MLRAVVDAQGIQEYPAVTDAGGSNLNYEIEQWDTNDASYVWVQVPALQSNTCTSVLLRSASQSVPNPSQRWHCGMPKEQHRGVSAKTPAHGNSASPVSLLRRLTLFNTLQP